MEVVILAGGLGTRLRSAIGNEIPKCMATVAGHPFLWYLFQYLRRFPITRVILSVGHLREVIFKWVDSVKDTFPFEITYAIEEVPLGTGGGIKLALEKCMDSTAFVLNGDTYFDVDLSELGKKLISDQALVELALKPMIDFDRYGSVTTDNDGQIKAFNEKTFCKSGKINGGVYAIDVQRFLAMQYPNKFSFERDVLEPQCSLDTLYGLTCNGYFIDIGIPTDYAKANVDFKTIF